MSHKQQRDFCERIKTKYPQYFSSSFVLDIGSLDINGNNSYLFDATSLYLGVDIAHGRNVDIVTPANKLQLPDCTFDIVISTECLEHDKYWMDTLRNAFRMLSQGGMLLITCATIGRPEHGTRRTTPADAPLLALVDDAWSDYYKNLTEDDFKIALDIESCFSHSEFSICEETHDLYFFGIKNGIYKKRLDRSHQIASHPIHIQMNMHKEQVHSLNRTISERDAALDMANSDIARLESSIYSLRNELNRTISERDAALNALYSIQQSRSWIITMPLRSVSGKLRSSALWLLLKRGRGAARYIIRGDFQGLLHRAKAIRNNKRIEEIISPKRWAVICTPHTLFIANLIAYRLQHHGFVVDILTEPPYKEGFPHDMYILIAAQMFEHLPPGEKRIIYQMEQSISNRWFNKKYFHALENSLAVLDYSIVNIEFLSNNGIAYPHLFYLPVGANIFYMRNLAETSKTIDVLFYGDSSSSPRRREMLESLKRHFKVHVCNEVYGLDMINTIRSARLVINLHYYENAILETPRIQECLSLGTPVVSESAQDQNNYPELTGAVTFFDAGDTQEMIRAVGGVLQACKNDMATISENISRSILYSQNNWEFMFDRFLVAQQFLESSHAITMRQPINLSTGRVAISMPETIARHKIFTSNKPDNCAIFNAVRKCPGWIGTGLSYSVLARKAIESKLDRLMIMEDDVDLPYDFEERIIIVNEYLDSLDNQWDVFSGLIAIMHPETRILNVADYKGMRFVTIDKMISMVCNIYNRSAIDIISRWNPDNRCDQKNTIDKYLEAQIGLRVVVALPFLVGHREDMHSTLWGVKNTHYTDLIRKSENALHVKALAYSGVSI